MRLVLKIFLLILTLVSCSSKNIVVLDDYQNGMKNLKMGNYNTAAALFEKIEDSKPFSEDATNGLIMSAYSYYKDKQYEDSIRVINYFLQANPINPNISYMYYLKGLNYYDRMTSMAKSRDIIETTDSIFKELLYKYPNSEYVQDAKSKLIKTESFLSGNEINIANYYLKQKNYIGASNHFINVLNNYPNSKFVPEALYRLIEINTFLNLKLEAVQYYKILSENYQDSNWTKYATKIMKKL